MFRKLSLDHKVQRSLNNDLRRAQLFRRACTRDGSAAEASKAKKYADVITGIDFIPLAIETAGTWGEQGFDLIRKIG